MIKYYIFDLDGTLIDSLQVWKNVGNCYLKGIGINGEPDLDNIMKNMSVSEASIYLKKHFLLFQSVEEIVNGIFAVVERRYEEDIQLKPGVLEFLQSCEKKGYKMCVLTASSSTLANKVLQRLGVLDYFENIYSCQTLGLSKNNSQIYMKIIEKINIKNEECIVIEDALYAIESAKKANLYVKAIYNRENDADWNKICSIADESYQTFKEMKI